MSTNNTKAFETYESEVRSYCRNFPTVFVKAKGSIQTDENGKEYIDFFCGSGALNYGHNNPYIKEKVVEYLQNDGVMHALDMYTKPKREFIEYFENEVIRPRGFDYKIQFVGPTGTNAVEAALKLARKVKKRNNVFALMGAFHGMTLGSLALTTNADSRKGAGVPLYNVTHIPAPYMFPELDTVAYMERLITDDHSGVEKPAAIILETTQADGGITLASANAAKILYTLDGTDPRFNPKAEVYAAAISTANLAAGKHLVKAVAYGGTATPFTSDIAEKEITVA